MLLRSGLIAALAALVAALGAGARSASAEPSSWMKHGGLDRGSGVAGYRVAGGPPPWAPAHGYRRKAKGKHRTVHRHEHHDVLRAEPRVIDLGRCNRDLIGAVLGGTVGGVIGSQVGDGSGRTVATVGGVLVGAVIGGAIGRRMDARDHACVAHALDLAPGGRAVSWANPETGVRYELKPLALYRADDGRSCREYKTKAVIDGKPRWSRGVACRGADGGWHRAG